MEIFLVVLSAILTPVFDLIVNRFFPKKEELTVDSSYSNKIDHLNIIGSTINQVNGSFNTIQNSNTYNQFHHYHQPNTINNKINSDTSGDLFATIGITIAYLIIFTTYFNYIFIFFKSFIIYFIYI